MEEVNDDRLLTDADVAEMLGVKPSWVADAARRGIIPYVPLGRYRRFRRSVVERWISEREQRAAA